MIVPSVCIVVNALNCAVKAAGASVRIVATHIHGRSLLQLLCIVLNDPTQIIGLHLAISAMSSFETPGWISVGVDSTSAVAALFSSATMHPKAAPRFEHAHGCAELSSFSRCFATNPSLCFRGLVSYNHDQVCSSSKRSHLLFQQQQLSSYQYHDVIQSVLWTLVLCGIFALSSALTLFLLLGLTCGRRSILCVCQSQVFLYSYSNWRLSRLLCPSSFVFIRICHGFVYLNEES